MPADVLLTFDFDAESPWVVSDPGDERRDLTQLSWGAYGARRGIGRIADLLDELGLKATFFVPGVTVVKHPERVQDLHRRGHEIAHHGFQHVPPVELSGAEQRDDLLRGIEAIESCIGVAPVGYRSPSWQLTPTTFAALIEHGFEYDSSCMGDDRPYVERHGELEILELPVSWTLDDFPHLGWFTGHNGPLNDPGTMILTWRREVEVAIAEERPIVLTAHPEVTGHPGPLAALAELLRDLVADPRVRFSRCVDVARASVGATSG